MIKPMNHTRLTYVCSNETSSFSELNTRAKYSKSIQDVIQDF